MAGVVPLADEDDEEYKGMLWAEIFRSTLIGPAAEGQLQFGSSSCNTPAATASTAAEIQRAQERIRARKQALEAKRQGKQSWYQIHPHGRLRQRWDIFNVVMIAHSAIAIPFQVCFEHEPSRDAAYLGIVVDALFFFDIVLNFCTGLENVSEKSITFQPKHVAASYLKGWFLVDFVSAFPWEVAIGSEDETSTLPQLVKVVKLGKLLRLLRVSFVRVDGQENPPRTHP